MIPNIAAQRKPRDDLGRQEEWRAGDRVSFPAYGKQIMRGTLRHLDVGRYVGLAILGDDNCYYELHSELTKKVDDEEQYK